jgi:hypothetical protein
VIRIEFSRALGVLFGSLLAPSNEPRKSFIGGRALRIHTLKRRQGVAGRPAEVIQFFADAYNLEKITPL